MVTHLGLIFTGKIDSLIHNLGVATTGATFLVIDASFALVERRSILNVVCSLTILYLVCSGRRTFGTTFVVSGNGFGATRTNFFDPILMSDFVLEFPMLMLGAAMTFGIIFRLIILVRVGMVVSANGSAIGA